MHDFAEMATFMIEQIDCLGDWTVRSSLGLRRNPKWRDREVCCGKMIANGFYRRQSVDRRLIQENAILLVRDVAGGLADTSEDNSLGPPLTGIGTRPADERQSFSDAELFERLKTPPSDFVRHQCQRCIVRQLREREVFAVPIG